MGTPVTQIADPAVAAFCAEVVEPAELAEAVATADSPTEIAVGPARSATAVAAIADLTVLAVAARVIPALSPTLISRDTS